MALVREKSEKRGNLVEEKGIQGVRGRLQ